MTRSTRKALILGLAVFAAGTLDAPAVQAQEDVSKVYKTVLRSTCWILHEAGGNSLITGSGSLVDAGKKIVLTNQHVVGDEAYVYVVFPMYDGKNNLISDREPYFKQLNTKKAIKSKVLLRNAKVDLAFIQLESLPPGVEQLPLSSQTAVTGQRVYSIGNPGGSGGGMWLLTDGTVRQVYDIKVKREQGEMLEAKVVTTTSATNHGDSGGPLFNIKGELIGVTQGYLPDVRDMSIFIDKSEVIALAKQAKVTFKVGRGNDAQVADKPPSASESETSTASASDAKPVETKPADPKAADAKANDNESKAAGKLRIAKSFHDKGFKDDAKAKFEEIIEKYPATKAAVEAKELLGKK